MLRIERSRADRPQPCGSVVELYRPISATYGLKWTMGTFAYSWTWVKSLLWTLKSFDS